MEHGEDLRQQEVRTDSARTTRVSRPRAGGSNPASALAPCPAHLPKTPSSATNGRTPRQSHTRAHRVAEALLARIPHRTATAASRLSLCAHAHTHKRHLPSLLSLFLRERKRETNPPHPQKHTTHKQNDDLSFPAPEGFPALSPPTHTHTHRQHTHHTPHTARRRSRSPPRALFNLHITLCRENRSPSCPKHRSSAARMRQRGSLYLV